MATAAAVPPGGAPAESFEEPSKKLSGDLKILLWSHFVPSHDTWFDRFVKDWAGEFVTQCWFIAKVTSIPVILISIPFGMVIALHVGSFNRQLGAEAAVQARPADGETAESLTKIGTRLPG